MQGKAHHPADALMHELIARPRAATADEVKQIIDRIATAPFNTDIQRVPPRERSFHYAGKPLGMYSDSLTLHLVRHVHKDRQWARGTTSGEYVDILHAAARDSQAKIALHQQWGTRDVAAVIAPTRMVCDATLLGPKSLPNLLVVYAANRGILITGYQFSTMDAIAIPGDAQWLK
jgi:hypothetical protein